MGRLFRDYALERLCWGGRRFRRCLRGGVPRPTVVARLPREDPRIFAQALRGGHLMVSQVEVASEECRVHGVVAEGLADDLNL